MQASAVSVPLRVLLGAARGEDHRRRAPRRAVRTARCSWPHRHAGDPLHPVRASTAATAPAHRVEAAGAVGDVGRVDQAVAGSRGAAGRWPAPGRCPGAAAGAASAAAAVAVRRGSTTMCCAPRSRCRRRSTAWPAAWCRPGCSRRAGSRRRAAMSASGNGRPAVDAEGLVRRPRRPTTCRSGRCSRCAACAARPGRTCRAVGLLVGQPAAAEAARRRRGRTRCWAAVIAAATRSSASSQVAVAQRLAACGRAPAASVSRSGWSSSSAARPALLAQPAAVGREVRALRSRSRRRRSRRRSPSCRTAASSTGSASRPDRSTRARVAGTRPHVPWSLFPGGDTRATPARSTVWSPHRDRGRTSRAIHTGRRRST